MWCYQDNIKEDSYVCHPEIKKMLMDGRWIKWPLVVSNDTARSVASIASKDMDIGDYRCKNGLDNQSIRQIYYDSILP